MTWLLSLLQSLFGGGSGAAGTSGAMGGAAGGATAATGTGAVGSAAAGSTLGTLANAGKDVLKQTFPDITQMGKDIAGGKFKEAGGTLGTMVGGKNLGNLIKQPSWANAGKLTQGFGDQMIAQMMMESLFGTGSRSPMMAQSQQRQPLQKPMARPPQMPNTDDPILRRMQSNLNPQARIY